MPSASKKFLTGASALALALAGTVFISAPAAAAQLTANDEPGLVAAITTANVDADHDVITLGADITLTADLPALTYSVEVVGNTFTIDADGHDVFTDTTATANIDLAFTGIAINNATPAIKTDNSNVTITNSEFNNAPVDIRGADVTVTAADSTFDNATADGVYMSTTGTSHVSITNSSASGNSSAGFLLSIFGANSTLAIADSQGNSNGTRGFWVLADGLDTPVTITGSSADTNDNRGFMVDASHGATISLSDTTATGNRSGGHMIVANAATVAVSDSAITDSDQGYGADVSAKNGSTVTLQRLTVSENDHGGVIVYDSGAGNTVTISESTLAANKGPGLTLGSLSAVPLSATDVVLDRSTISGNTSDGVGGVGGINAGLQGASSLSVSNSTISGNSGDDVGGIRMIAVGGAARIDVAHSTIVNNVTTGPFGGPGGLGIFAGQYTLNNTVVAGNTGRGTFGDFNADNSAVGTIDYSLVQSATNLALTAMGAGTGNISNTAAMLGPLANNGGSTSTHLPLEGSPLINAGNAALSGSPATDQRGLNRFVDTVDIGAVEMQGESTTPGDSTPAAPGGDEVLAVTGSYAALPLFGGATLLLALGAAFTIASRRLASN